MKQICPKLGHLVGVRKGSALDKDGDYAHYRNYGLIVNTRGIEVQVLLPSGLFSWVRRDQLEVINANR